MADSDKRGNNFTKKRKFSDADFQNQRKEWTESLIETRDQSEEVN